MRAVMIGDQAQKTIDAMTDSLTHRGPDDRGTWLDGSLGVALGHRRLSVVDLSPAGHQPMISSDGRYVIVYNGEVYSTAEIRVELEKKGILFRGHSDTEVILEGFVAYGIDATLQRLIGMFAIAVWDRQDRRLSLIRDRMGIKPLYWGLFGKMLVFGSELKALRAHPGWIPELDRGALESFLELSFIPAPWSIYRDVQKLPAGQALEIGLDGEARCRAFWSLDHATKQDRSIQDKMTDAQAEEELHIILKDAVGRCMIADVPLGAFLSGGVDSSAVVALMQSQSSRPVKTFSIGFNESGFDEAIYARQVAKHLGTEHTELYVGPEYALSKIQEIPQFFDEPFGDVSQIPTYLISALTRRHVTVALSGDGGDELFAGYNRYLAIDRLRNSRVQIPLSIRRLAAKSLSNVSDLPLGKVLQFFPASERIYRVLERTSKLAAVLAMDDVETMHRHLVCRWTNGRKAVIGNSPIRALSVNRTSSTRVNRVEAMQILDMLTYLPDDVLTKVDRASMAVGLEVRVPLLDHRLVELSVKLPFRMKIRHTQTKWLLRKVLSRYVPETLVNRPKMGFSVPIGKWLRGPLRHWAEDLLNPSRLATEGILRTDIISRLWDEHQSGRFNRQGELWNTLMFQAWLQRNSL